MRNYDYVLYHSDVGILNSVALPTDLANKLKSYSGWRLGSLTINGDLNVKMTSEKFNSDASKVLDTSNADCSSTSSNNQ